MPRKKTVVPEPDPESEPDVSSDNDNEGSENDSDDESDEVPAHPLVQDNENMNDYCLYIKTTQSNIIRLLFESLKNILEDVNIVCNDQGMKIMATNKIKVAFVHLDLKAEKFREGGVYHCPQPVTIGVNLTNFEKTLKPIGLNDIITFYMRKDDVMRQEYKLNLLVTKPGNYQRTQLTINLLDIEDEPISLPECQFNSIFTIPSSNFQRIARDLSNYSDTVQFVSIGKTLKLCASGDLGENKTIIGEQDSPIDPDEEPIVANFPLKYLNLFTKATGLSNSVDFLFNKQQGNRHMLIVQYKVASLGTLRFCLAEKIVDYDD